MNRFIFLIVLTWASLPLSGQMPISWQTIQTVDDVCSVYPERMEKLLQQINLATPGLEQVKSAFDQKQIAEACRLLLNYYRDGTTAQYLRSVKPAEGQATDGEADLMANNT